MWRPELLKAQASGRLPGAPPHYFMTISTPFSRPGQKKDSWAEVVGWWSNQQTPPSCPRALVAQSPVWLPLSPPTKRLRLHIPASSWPHCCAGRELGHLLRCRTTDLVVRQGQPRTPPVWGTASTSVLVEISHSAFTAIAAVASSRPEVPPWALPLSEERGVAPSYHGPHTDLQTKKICHKKLY